MINIFLALLLSLIAYYFYSHIRKHFNVLLVLSLVLGIIGYANDVSLIVEGFLGMALIVVVMFAGVLKKGSKLKKALMGVRKEYSILGFVFIVFHFLANIHFDASLIAELDLIGTLALIIMIPLFVTSFTFIRKKMTSGSWKKLHKFSYLAYTATFLHVILVTSEAGHRVAYSVLIVVYMLLRVKNRKN